MMMMMMMVMIMIFSQYKQREGSQPGHQAVKRWMLQKPSRLNCHQRHRAASSATFPRDDPPRR